MMLTPLPSLLRFQCIPEVLLGVCGVVSRLLLDSALLRARIVREWSRTSRSALEVLLQCDGDENQVRGVSYLTSAVSVVMTVAASSVRSAASLPSIPAPRLSASLRVDCVLPTKDPEQHKRSHSPPPPATPPHCNSTRFERLQCSTHSVPHHCSRAATPLPPRDT